MLGLHWKSGTSCRSPFREDRNASFSVFDDGRRFKDHATGETGDAIDFLQMATGLDTAAAIAEFKQLAGCEDHRPTAAPLPPRKTKPANAVLLPADLHPGTDTELQKLAQLRNVSLEGLQIATGRGLLFFGTVDGLPCWIITDGTHRNAQARRIDGKLFAGINAKAKTLPGSAAAWPIGADRLQHCPNVALCEGGPDVLAAFHFMYCENAEATWTAVCIAGASNRIPEDALPLFAGKRVRVFAHLDEAGRQAAERWERQLAGLAVQSDVFNLQGIDTSKGATVNDLNDLTSLTPEAFENDRDLWTLFDVEGGAA